jgi:hypothetical protein
MGEGELQRRRIGAPESLFNGKVRDVKLKEVDVPDLPPVEIKKSFWNDKPLGRTLSGKNKTGKTIIGGVGAVITTITSLDLTGVISVINLIAGITEMELLTGLTGLFSGFEFAEWGTIIVCVALTMFVTWLATTGRITQKFATALTDIIKEYREAKSKTSEDGEKISDKEKAELFDKLLIAIEQLLFDMFGWALDLNQDGQKPTKE